ncbi:hypothetical protein Tco_1203702 [Tanacetum coccineum]
MAATAATTTRPPRVRLVRLHKHQQGTNDDVAAHSRRVKFNTACSCLIYKDILYASRFKNQERSSSKTKTSANSNKHDLPKDIMIIKTKTIKEEC